MVPLAKMLHRSGRGRSWSWPGLRNDRHSGNQCEGWLFCFGLGIGNRLDVIGPCLQRDPPPLDHLAGPIRPLRLVALVMGNAMLDDLAPEIMFDAFAAPVAEAGSHPVH